MKITPAESKTVGWEGSILDTFPEWDEIEKAERVQLLTWHRFLREGRNKIEHSKIVRISSRLDETFPEGVESAANLDTVFKDEPLIEELDD